jgi:serine/threonine protein phosphatase PrpC
VLRAAGFTDTGRIRPTNEDCFGINEALGLCVVADGMGGHNAGEVASRIAVDAVIDYVRSAGSDWPFGYVAALSEDANLLRTAIQIANLQILEAALTTNDYAGMGTTIVAARVTAGRVAIAHAGDSRLYLLNSRGLRQMTNDDSWVATILASNPAVDALLLSHHPMRNALTNAVGTCARTDVHVVEETLTGDDLLLLTTDGVHGVMDHRRIRELLTGHDDPATIVARVVAAAIARGSDDNCTAIVARYTR